MRRMHLSTAMLKGAKMAPQTTSYLKDWNGNTCALGAACMGAGIPIREIQENLEHELLPSFWLPLLTSHTTCPCCGEEMYLENVIIHLNDDTDWSRERIARWARTVEYRTGARTKRKKKAPKPDTITVRIPLTISDPVTV